MRRHIITIATLASIAAGAAMASTTTVGTIKTLDMKSHMITLQDGSSYQLSAAFKDPGLKVGQKVSVTWDLKGKVNEASDVKVSS